MPISHICSKKSPGWYCNQPFHNGSLKVYMLHRTFTVFHPVRIKKIHTIGRIKRNFLIFYRSVCYKPKGSFESVQFDKEEPWINPFFLHMYPPKRNPLKRRKKNPEMSRNRDTELAIALSCSFMKNVLAGRAPLEAEVTWLAVLKWDYGNFWKKK